MDKWLVDKGIWLPIVNKKQKRIFIIGIISTLLGFILMFGSRIVGTLSIVSDGKSLEIIRKGIV